MPGGVVPPLPHDPPCPACGHDHLWLPCDWCGCCEHLRNGID